jgi:hypothetical protein
MSLDEGQRLTAVRTWKPIRFHSERQTGAVLEQILLCDSRNRCQLRSPDLSLPMMNGGPLNDIIVYRTERERNGTIFSGMSSSQSLLVPPLAPGEGRRIGETGIPRNEGSLNGEKGRRSLRFARLNKPTADGQVRTT